MTGVIAPTVPEQLAPDAASRRSPSSQPRLHTVTRGHLAEELELLDQARNAIAQKNYAEALDHLDAHARDFQNGQLAEEREAIRVEALAEMGRHEEALLVARSFASRFPHSILRPVVEKLSAAPP